MPKKAKFERWEHYKTLKGLKLSAKEESTLFALAANSEVADLEIEELYEAYNQDRDTEISNKREAGEFVKRGHLMHKNSLKQGWQL